MADAEKKEDEEKAEAKKEEEDKEAEKKKEVKQKLTAQEYLDCKGAGLSKGECWTSNMHTEAVALKQENMVKQKIKHHHKKHNKHHKK